MSILHRYILSELFRNIVGALFIFVSLFVLLDFFERIDNIVAEDASFWLTVQYFALKVPLTISLMLPIAMLVGSLFTFGLLCRNSEFTAMRAAGASVLWLCSPALLLGLGAGVCALILNETVVPAATHRVREIYNIDIRKKDKRGGYSRNDLWWREGGRFYNIERFESSTSTMQNVTILDVTPEFRISDRVDAREAHYVDPILGWTLRDITAYKFIPNTSPAVSRTSERPLPITARPEEFYNVEADAHAMSYRELKGYIAKQSANGLPVAGFMADLYAKFAAPFLSVIITLAALPFALLPARTGRLAPSFLAGIVIGFSYFAVDSLSLSLGRAEIWPAFLSAWMANVILGVVGATLLAGAEAPT